MEYVQTSLAPTPLGHYSQATVHNGVVYVATQLPLVPGENPDPSGSVAEQTLQVLQNITGILKEAGSSRENILRLMVYVADVSDWAAVNSTCETFFGDHKPARGVLEVASLKAGYKVSMDAIAAVD